MTTTDETALLAAIAADLGDDTVRLAYADWLDENDQPDRAEFIRVQVELCCLNNADIKTFTIGDNDRRRTLHARECQLLIQHAHEWLPLMLREQVAGDGTRYPYAYPVVFRRGFIASVTVPMAKFMEEGTCFACGELGFGAIGKGGMPWGVRCPDCHGTGRHPSTGFAANLVREVPTLERIEFSDVTVFPSGGNDTYYVGGLGVFHRKYWERLQDHRTIADARNALSDVALSQAREWAWRL